MKCLASLSGFSSSSSLAAAAAAAAANEVITAHISWEFGKGVENR